MKDHKKGGNLLKFPPFFFKYFFEIFFLLSALWMFSTFSSYKDKIEEQNNSFFENKKEVENEKGGYQEKHLNLFINEKPFCHLKTLFLMNQNPSFHGEGKLHLSIGAVEQSLTFNFSIYSNEELQIKRIHLALSPGSNDKALIKGFLLNLNISNDRIEIRGRIGREGLDKTIQKSITIPFLNPFYPLRNNVNFFDRKGHFSPPKRFVLRNPFYPSSPLLVKINRNNKKIVIDGVKAYEYLISFGETFLMQKSQKTYFSVEGEMLAFSLGKFELKQGRELPLYSKLEVPLFALIKQLIEKGISFTDPEVFKNFQNILSGDK